MAAYRTWNLVLSQMRHSYNSVSPFSRNVASIAIIQRQILTEKFLLASKWNIKPVRTLTGTFETSLNAPGFSISLCNLSAASRESDTSVDELLELLDAPTTAVGWPNLTPPNPHQNGVKQNQLSQTKAKIKSNDGSDITCKLGPSQLLDIGTELISCVVDPKLLDTVIRSACEAAIAAEPNLTKWDTISEFSLL